MTTFTADCVTLEDRRSILVDRACHGLDPVRMAVQAIGLDRPVEMRLNASNPGDRSHRCFREYQVRGDSKRKPSCSIR